MTVCIAAICEQGKRIVSATDRLLSTGDVTGGSVAAKMSWMANWQFMYAGSPGTVGLVTSKVFEMATDDPVSMSRRRIQATVRSAYRKCVAESGAFDVLNAYDMTLEEFKTNGRARFGDALYAELAGQIKIASTRMQDQILVTGWGQAPASAIIYEIGPSGEYDSSVVGFGVIGSGAGISQSVLMLLGQGRDCTLAETIFNVAVAKFFSERSAGLDVGYGTATCIQSKTSDEGGGSSSEFLSEDEVGELRTVWEEHVKLRIPDEARVLITRLAQRFRGGTSTAKDMVETRKASNRLNKSLAERVVPSKR